MEHIGCPLQAAVVHLLGSEGGRIGTQGTVKAEAGNNDPRPTAPILNIYSPYELLERYIGRLSLLQVSWSHWLHLLID